MGRALALLELHSHPRIGVVGIKGDDGHQSDNDWAFPPLATPAQHPLPEKP